MKIYRRPRTWILAAALLITIIAVAVIAHQVSADATDGRWKQKVQEQIQKSQQDLKNLDNVPAPFRSTARANTEEQLTRLQYSLNHNINPYETNSWSFVNGAATGIISLVALLVVIVASDIVAGEFSWGTIKLLMIRPHHRWSILLSKYVTAMIYSFVMLLLLLVFSWLVGDLIFGFGSMNYANIVVNNGHVLKETASIKALETFGLEFITMMIIMSIAFMISTIFRNSALAIGISIFILYMVNMLGYVLNQFEWTKYLIFANLDLSYYLDHSEGVIKGMTFSFSLIVDAVYWLTFIIITWWTFQKRDIST